MFGSLKKLFSRQPDVVQPAQKSVPAPAPIPKPSTQPTVRPAAPVAKAAPPATSPTPAPDFAATPPAAQSPSAAPPPRESASSSPGSHSDEKLVLALKSVVARIPADLMPLVKSTAGNLEFPLQRILDQLPQGSVRFSLAEIRASAPSGTFGDIAAYEQIQVELPLQTILSLIGPSAFTRRAPLKRLNAPAEVGDLFGSKGEAKIVTQSTAPAQPAMARPVVPAKPSSTTPAASVPSAPVPAMAPVAPAAALPKPASAPIKPASALPTPPSPKPAAPVQAAPVTTPASGASASISGAKLPPPSSPALPKPSLPTPPPTALAKPAAPSPSSSIPRPPTPPPAKFPATPTPLAAAAKPVPALQVALPEISAGWPEVVRIEIATLAREQSLVALPFDLVDRGLRSGRVLFTWKQIGEWLKPEPITSSPHGEETVEIPLAVIAPRFLAQFKPNRPQKKITVGDNVPDIFTGQQRKATPQTQPPAPAPSPASAPAAAPVASVPPSAPVLAAPVAEPAPARVAAPAVQSVAELFGQPGKQSWSFNEIVQGTAGLPGISGAVVGSQDGLLIAGQLPTPLSGETVAAFLPQMFGRISQYSTELKAGDLTVITLGFGPVSWQILRTGEFYFATMGKAGEPLPTSQLATIATELGRQKK